MKKFKLIKQENLKAYTDLNHIIGYEVRPKLDSAHNTIKIKKLVLFDRQLVKLVLEKKVQKKLDFYIENLFLTIEEEDEEPVRKALDDIERFRTILVNRYYMFLDENYYELLLKKLNNLYGKLQEKRMLFVEKDNKMVESTKKSR